MLRSTTACLGTLVTATAQCTTAIVPLPGGTDGPVSVLRRLANGDLLVAGSFTTLFSATANNIARWNGTTVVPLGAGLGGPVRDAIELPNGDATAEDHDWVVRVSAPRSRRSKCNRVVTCAGAARAVADDRAGLDVRQRPRVRAQRTVVRSPAVVKARQPAPPTAIGQPEHDDAGRLGRRQHAPSPDRRRSQ